jgi:hypothetical protein
MEKENGCKKLGPCTVKVFITKEVDIGEDSVAWKYK